MPRPDCTVVGGISDGQLHVLFLNTQNVLRADVSVHVSLARAFDREHLRVSVATNLVESAGDSARAAFAAIPDLTLLPVDLGRPVSTRRGIHRATALLANLRAGTTLLRLAQWCRRERVDVIHVTERPRDALSGLILARLAGCAIVIHGHTTYYAHPPSRSAALADWVLQHADGVVGVSCFTARSFWQAGPVARERVHAVHNATDAVFLQPKLPPDARASMRQDLGIPANAPVIGSVGRLMGGKDQASLVTAFVSVKAAFPEARLILAGEPADRAPDGEGDYRDYLVRQVRRLGLEGSVIFAGVLPHAQMPRLYSALDVFAHPCVEEPFGLVLVEALASSVPLVGIHAGGVPEIVRDNVDGRLVAPRSPAALAQSIIAVLRDPVTARQLACSGRGRVLARFTPAVQAHAMLQVYREVLAARARGH